MQDGESEPNSLYQFRQPGFHLLLTRTARNGPKKPLTLLAEAQFDGYTASLNSPDPADLFKLLSQLGDTIRTEYGSPFFRYRSRLIDADGFSHACLYFGAKDSDLVSFEILGPRTNDAVARLRATYPHRCSRVDSYVDMEQPGAFAELHRVLLLTKRKHRLFGQRLGDWDDPVRGRTHMLGSPKSRIQIRLYEKGLTPRYRHLDRPDWVRLELQVRPSSAGAKLSFASLTPVEIWGASKWTRELAVKVLGLPVARQSPRAAWKQSDRDHALSWMLKAYGRHLESLATEVGWDRLGMELLRRLTLAANQ